MTTQLVWLATQDVMQVLLVVMCVYAGWSAWSLLLHLLTCTRDGKQAAAAKLITLDDSKLVEVDAEQEEEPEKTACWAQAEASKRDGARGLAILEHYGVFGAAPGVWEGRAKTVTHQATCDEDSF
uniref:Uncharacterized protein n=1 Tax=Strombidinopsis acuminata TaxID=141414 RepID=A0A7S3X640_9SPIT|mmetsp:Transcript_10540/g.27245  ORF Transcript_10540/g.27245 Transcript_10540/m.27245 type:complete len:125 (-) Transcript_10540:88-462(-)